MRKVLALGAHFDDIEIGIGGILEKHVSVNDEVYMAITDSNENRTGDINIRYREQLKAMNIIGVKKQRLLLFNMEEDISNVVEILDKLNPDIIYTHFEKDTHQAHRRCSHIGQAIGRKSDTQVFFYNSGAAYDFTPNTFYPVLPSYKSRLLKCFKSQIAKKAVNIESIQKREAYWSTIVKSETGYMEALLVKKMLYKIR